MCAITVMLWVKITISFLFPIYHILQPVNENEEQNFVPHSENGLNKTIDQIMNININILKYFHSHCLYITMN